MKFKLAFLAIMSLFPVDRPAQEARSHDKEFWLGIVADGYALPEGEQAYDLLLDLNLLLDSPDAVLRDEIGYAISTQWIYRQGLFTEEQLCQQVDYLSGRLRVGLGSTSGEQVLGRSFGALGLALLVATDIKKPFLNEDRFDALLESALAYLAGERDLRGWNKELGWMHSVAHTADLFKFLGRHPRLNTESKRVRVFEGLGLKTIAPSGKLFAHGEDERLAQALLSLLRRRDFEMQEFDGFRQILQRAPKLAPMGGAFSPVANAATRNAKNVLRVLLEALRSGQIENLDRAEALEERILGSLRALG